MYCSHSVLLAACTCSWVLTLVSLPFDLLNSHVKAVAYTARIFIHKVYDPPFAALSLIHYTTLQIPDSTQPLERYAGTSCFLLWAVFTVTERGCMLIGFFRSGHEPDPANIFDVRPGASRLSHRPKQEPSLTKSRYSFDAYLSSGSHIFTHPFAQLCLLQPLPDPSTR